MALTHIGRVLAERVHQEIADTGQSVVDGAANDYAAYRYHVGFVHGMKRALSILEEIEGED